MRSAPLTSYPARFSSAVASLFAAAMTFMACALPATALAGQNDLATSADGRVSAFYTWSEPVPAPGRMLRQEALDPALRLAAAGEQFRILYSATDGVDGQRHVAVSGALYLPPGQAPEGGWPLLAWAHGTVGIADVCAPSWAVHSYRDAEYLNAWLAHGYAIVATDYQGLGTPGPHPYMDARAEAYSVLDSIRAVQAAYPSLSRKTILIGQSQGASAAFASAAFAPQYAPDLDILGTIATGTPYLAPKAMAAASQQDHDKVRPEFAYTAFIAIAAQQLAPHPQKLSQLFTPRALALVEEAHGACIAQLEADVVTAGITDNNAYRGKLMSFLGQYAATFVYPTVKLETPLFMGIGAEDESAKTPSQLMLVHDACAAGTTVQAHLYRGLSHDATVNASLRDSLPFAQDLLAGRKITPVCAPKPQ